MSSSILGRANGAYAASNKTIYLSQEYVGVNANQPQAVADVLLEEIGHYVDSRINSFDAAGDEGEIFSALVQGKALSEQQLKFLRIEDDSATITLSGQSLGIEQSVNPIKYKYFYYDDPNAPLPLIDANKDTIVVIHGWNGNFSSNLGILAQQLAEQNSASQVIALDWSQTADQTTPYLAAGYIKAVAEWAVGKLAGLASKITLIGHSLGSYVAAEISRELGGVGEVVALDPAYALPGFPYDIDKRDSNSNPVGNFRNDTNQSLALVAADLYGTGAAGDTYQAGTADKSFIVKFSDLNYGLVSAGDAHSGVIDIYNALESRNLDISSGIIFANIPQDTFDNEGDPVTLGAGGLHEGVINAIDVDSTSQRLWKSKDIVGNGWRVYIVDSNVNKPTGSDGIDTVSSSVTFTLENTNIENLALAHTLNGVDILNINGTGNTLNNILIGNIGNNSLDGKEGDDILDGGVGNDYLHGGLGNDNLYGGNGNDTLNAGLGRDVVDGGTGTDLLIVDYSALQTNIGIHYSSADLATGSGYLFNSLYDGTYASNRVNFSGIERFNITGTNQDDGLYGAALGDTLVGGAGNDYIDGKSGNDTLKGEAGDDTLVNAGGADIIDGGDGTDILVDDNFASHFASGTADIVLNPTSGLISLSDGTTIANVEAFWLTGGNGNDRLVMTGAYNDNLYGGNGNDTLNAGLGRDVVDGGTGTDLLIVDYSALQTNIGIHYSSADLATGSGYLFNSLYDGTYASNRVNFSGIERFNITGTNQDDGLYGAALGDTLVGGAGNDYIDGKSGNDTLKGEAGDDTLVNAGGADIIDGGDGTDILVDDNFASHFASGTADIVLNPTSGLISLSDGTTIANVEAFWLTGGNGNDRLVMTGAYNDNLYGGNGNDTLNAGLGRDVVDGGTGTDLLIIDYSALQTNIGIHYSSVDLATGSGYLFNSLYDGTYASNRVNFSGIDRFNITGTNQDDGLHGAALGDALVGGAGNDYIDGKSGNDLLDGGIGVDTLIGGTGNDTYTVDNTSDVVTENANEGVDTVKSSVSYTLKDNFENLILTGTASINGTGNSLNNQITGNAANNILNGGIGADKLIGGNGNDTYSVDNLGDVVTETSTVATQIDTVQSTINYTLGANVENLTLIGTAAINGTGNALSNTLTGNSGNNILNGGIGADTLNGGAGIDTASYTNAAAAVNVNLSNATAGTTGEATGDVLNAIENLLGSNFNDILIGNSTANILNGGTGADKLTGGTGNDVYVVDNTADIVSETSTLATEIDTVQSAINYSLGANLENLTLTGTAAINGTGNTLNNIITGNGANNILNGGAGSDTLNGGLGNDTYIIENAPDLISEAANAGIDTVQSSISWILGNNLENLTLTGTAAINGTGNTLNNTITGNAANNTLSGGAGNDILIGGAGNDIIVGDFGDDILTGGSGSDRFSFNSPNEKIDKITDFLSVDDTISIKAAGFGGGLSANAAILATQFLSGAGVTTASNATQRFLYNTTSGALFFDADGNGTGAGALQIATLTGNPNITTADIFVTA